MTRKAPLHIVDSCSRQRAELARVGFALGHHCEVYGDLSELSAHPPRDGLIIARDTVEDGGVGMILERLGRLGIWPPLIAVEVQPRPLLLGEPVVDAVIWLCRWIPNALPAA